MPSLPSNNPYKYSPQDLYRNYLPKPSEYVINNALFQLKLLIIFLIISKFTPMYAMWSNVVISRPIAY
eukprot:UN04111